MKYDYNRDAMDEALNKEGDGGQVWVPDCMGYVCVPLKDHSKVTVGVTLAHKRSML